MIDVADKLPLTVAAAPDEAKVGAVYTALAAGCCRTCNTWHQALPVPMQTTAQIRSLVAGLPASLPTVHCCAAVAKVGEAGQAHLGWQLARPLVLDAVQAQRAPSLPPSPSSSVTAVVAAWRGWRRLSAPPSSM